MMKSNSFQDIIFLSGIIIFSSILIIGLFPGRLDDGVVNEKFFFATAMTVPVIAAIYFIIISFRRRLEIRSREIRASLSKKLTISFLFIAVLSTMPIVIVSSTYFNQNIAMMFKGSTGVSIRESIDLTNDLFKEFAGEVRNELRSVKYFVKKNKAHSFNIIFDEIKKTLVAKGFSIFIFQKGKNKITFQNTLPGNSYGTKIQKFYKNFSGDKIKTDRILINGKEIICGVIELNKNIFVLSKEIPLELSEREKLFYKANDDYQEVERLRNFFVEGSGAFLMVLSILIVGIAYLISFFLSKSITHPLEELSEASGQISKGDYGVELPGERKDEIGQLIQSFNSMSKELKQNRDVMFEKQKLEAWNDMARKLVHEIKNPLTPIRLSAERIRRLVLQNKKNMEDSILQGTETIMAEVDSLLSLVRVFNDFARLPEKKEEVQDISELICETVILYSAHENIQINFEPLDEKLFVFLDKVLMKQALNNILSNAVEAIEVKGEISIEVQKNQENQIEISIRDTGGGINAKDVENIFQPGFTLKKHGTGLGLAIVHKIILEHHGKILCNSVLGKGSEFIITLPIKNGDL